MKLAAIDIGSNAVRLLIRRVNDGFAEQSPDTLFITEHQERVALKSGTDTFAYGEIQPKTEIFLTAAICRFARIMEAHGVDRYRGCATSAYRDARNGREVIERVNRVSGLNIEVISGQEEALITCCAYIAPREWTDDHLLFVDVGGGSTEVTLKQYDTVLYSHSFRVGSMRYVCGNQPADQIALLDHVVAGLHEKYGRVHFVGVGGCVKFMRDWLNGRKQSDTFQVSDMRALYEKLKSLTPDEISFLYNVSRERADILVPASSIFLRIADGFGSTEITAPVLGVREGIITELYQTL